MDTRSRDARTGDPEPEEGSVRWGWVAGFGTAVVAFGGLVGAVLLTPGDPFVCNLPNPRGWLLCNWTRAFAANLVSITVALVVGSTLLALLVGIPRAVLRAIRN
ncbi:hypothetical protein [Haladaptatus sp. NG-SE-30]